MERSDAGRGIGLQPIGFDGSGQFYEFVDVAWLHQIGVRAEVVGLVDVFRLAGRGEHDDGKALEQRSAADPGEQLEAGFFGELQIKEQEGWDLIAGSKGKV